MEELIEFPPYSENRFWEIHFTSDRVYLVATKVSQIWVYDWDFKPVDTIHTTKHIWGLTSFAYGCDSVETYATHMAYSTEEFLGDSGLDRTMHISRYDLSINVLTPVCDYWMGDDRANTNMTSPLEFLASDPECDLLLDLDRDNSTGVFPYDYRDTMRHCYPLSAPVSDVDLYLNTSVPMDSATVTIAGVRDPGLEDIVLVGGPPGFILSATSDTSYVLRPPGVRPDDAWRQALLALRYRHAGQARTPGVRQVIVRGYNAIKAGTPASAWIRVEALPYAGLDGTVLACGDTIIPDLRVVTGGQPGGRWWPALASGDMRFDSRVDGADRYYYIVSGGDCTPDTAVVAVVRDAAGPADLLGPDRPLCPGDTLRLEVTVSSGTIHWSDGATGTTRAVTTPGIYAVELTTPEGCRYGDTIDISAGAVWTPIPDVEDATCGEANGVIRLVAPWPAGAWVRIDGQDIAPPGVTGLAPGSYTIDIVSADGCMSRQAAEVADIPAIRVAMDSVLEVPEGRWVPVAVSPLTSAGVAQVLFLPGDGIRWTGHGLEVQGQESRRYTLLFVDENGCIDERTLDVRVTELGGVYVPNVFRPGSTAGNAVWEPQPGPGYRLEMVRIYDRWGNEQYAAVGEAAWDGTRNGVACPSGVYVYQLVLSSAASPAPVVLRGDITLLR